MSLNIPHPTLLFLAKGIPDPPNCPEDTCSWARKFRIKLRDALCESGACKELPVEIRDAEGGEKYDHAGYVKMLSETIEWTYKICQLQAEVEEGPYMATNSPRSCKNDHHHDCGHYGYGRHGYYRW